MTTHTTSPWRAGLLAAALLLGAAPGTHANTAGDDRQGTFKLVQGEVTVIHGETRRAATLGGPLRATERVQTGAKSAAAITLIDGTVMTLGPNATMELQQASFDGTTQDGNLLVSVLRGTMRMVTGAIAKLNPQHVQVTTPTSVIGIRGTDFIVEVNP